MKVKGPIRVGPEDFGGLTRPRQVYSTPQRPPLDSLYSPANSDTPVTPKHNRLRYISIVF